MPWLRNNIIVTSQKTKCTDTVVVALLNKDWFINQESREE